MKTCSSTDEVNILEIQRKLMCTSMYVYWKLGPRGFDNYGIIRAVLKLQAQPQGQRTKHVNQNKI